MKKGKKPYLYSYCPVCGGRAKRQKKDGLTYLCCIETACKKVSTVQMVAATTGKDGVEFKVRIRRHRFSPRRN